MPSEWDYYSCGTVALMILDQFSDICGPTFRIFQFFFFFHLMATVNWLTILPLFGCAHKNLNVLRRNKVKFIYSANKNSVI